MNARSPELARVAGVLALDLDGPARGDDALRMSPANPDGGAVSARSPGLARVAGVLELDLDGRAGGEDAPRMSPTNPDGGAVSARSPGLARVAGVLALDGPAGGDDAPRMSPSANRVELAPAGNARAFRRRRAALNVAWLV